MVRAVNAWTYAVVDSITPSSGQTGTIVTIAGIGLLAGGNVVANTTLAGVLASSIVSASDTQIVVVAGASGVSVSGPSIVSTNGGQVRSQAGISNQFSATFAYQTPGAISTIVPSQGQAGTLVTISGTQLFGYGSGVANVTLAGVAATVVLQLRVLLWWQQVLVAQRLLAV